MHHTFSNNGIRALRLLLKEERRVLRTASSLKGYHLKPLFSIEPNPFSPDGDGNNDFAIINSGLLKKSEYLIKMSKMLTAWRFRHNAGMTPKF